MPRVLVIDDDQAIRAMFARTLRTLGDVDEAKDGAEALKLLAATRYDVIVLDWHMPSVDGATVLRRLEEPGPNRDTPIVVVTADGREHAKATALRDGALFFLNKPVPLATLAVFVKTAMAKRRTARGLAR